MTIPKSPSEANPRDENAERETFDRWYNANAFPDLDLTSAKLGWLAHAALSQPTTVVSEDEIIDRMLRVYEGTFDMQIGNRGKRRWAALQAVYRALQAANLTPKGETTGDVKIGDFTLAELRQIAKRDDCLERLVPSDLRQILGLISPSHDCISCEELVEALREHHSWAKRLSNHLYEDSELRHETDKALANHAKRKGADHE